MKWKFFLGIFSFLCCVICLNNDHQTTQTPTGASVNYTWGFTRIAPDDLNIRENIISEKTAGGFLVTPLNLEGSTLFTSYNKGTNSSLLVLERWERSPLIDNSSCNPSLFSQKTGHRKVKANDNSAMLFSADAPKREK